MDAQEYKQIWLECSAIWKRHFQQDNSTIRIGYIHIDSAGNEIFVEMSCPYCQMNTGRQHELNCINNFPIRGEERGISCE